MKHLFLILLAFSLMSFSVIKPEAKSDTNAIAKVGNHEIKVEQFVDRYVNFILSSGINDNFRTRLSVLNNLISEILLSNYDDNKEIVQNPEYKKRIEWVRKETVLAFLKDREVYAKLSVPEEELRKAFVRLNQKVSARHLFAGTEEEAKKLYGMLKAGASFEDLAQKVFIDTVLKNNGGYLGYFTWGDMDPAFEEVAFSMIPGEISNPVKTSYGYSIIKVEDKVTLPIITENDYLKKKRSIERAIKIQKKKPAEINYLKSMVNIDNLKIENKAVDNIYKNLMPSIQSDDLEFSEKKPTKSKRKAVTYNNKTYSESEIENRILNMPFEKVQNITDKEALKAVIKGIVVQDVLMNEAAAKGYDKNPEVLYAFQNAAKQVFLNYKKYDISRATTVKDSVLRQYYKEFINNFKSPDQVNVQEIIVDNKELADSLKNLIDNRADFGTLAKKYSLRETSKKFNGETGFDDIEKFGMFKDVFSKSSMGEILGPLRFDKYYAIFKILGKKEGKPYEFPEVKDYIQDIIKLQQQYKMIEDYVQTLSKKVKIEINEDLLSSVDISK